MQCFIYKTVSQFSEILIFTQDIWGNVHYVQGFVDKGQLKTINPKKRFQNIPSKFLLFKASAFLQIFFQRNLFFRQVLRMSVFLNSKCLIFLPIYFFTKEHRLKTSNKRPHIPLLINQFVSLIKLKI